MRASLCIVLAGLALSPAGAAAEELDVAAVVERYVAARGGAAAWNAADTLELTGVYAAFSFHRPFRLIRKRGDQYRLEYVVLDSPATRARDGVGPWGQDPLLWPQATRLEEEPYRSQLVRESLFGLVLLDAESRGIAVELIGEGEVEGVSTVDLRLSFPGEREEIWHLDAESWLEVAVDAEVFDHTQSVEAMPRRTFFDDFREVQGLILPFQVDYEFGARLEAMTVREARVNPELEAEAFAAPPAPPADAAAAAPEDGGTPSDGAADEADG